MLRSLVGWSLRYRGVVIALAALLLGYGVWVARHSRLDVFPEFAPPQVVIQTEAAGLSPEDVEALVTRPIEAAVNGVSGLLSLRSQSIQGFSVATAIFEDGTDVLLARQLVAQRLAELAGRLPEGVELPVIAPLTSSTSLVLAVGLTSEQRSPRELRTFSDGTLRPRLLGVPGVANVVEFGGEVRQLQVRVRPERLAALGLSLEPVIAAARASTGVLGAGFIDTQNQRIVVRTEGQSLRPEDLGATVVAQHDGAVVRLADVADVVEGSEPRLGDAAIMGRPGVLLLVWSQFGANTLQVTTALEGALQELAPALDAAGIAVRHDLFRPADFIELSVHNIGVSLLLGGAFVAVVLFLFLLDLRTALISFIAIPLSLLAAVIVLDRQGGSLNTMTLGGLAIAIGVVVDDAIIDVENILRRLREARAAGSPRPLLDIVLDASLEVRSAVVYATFIVALVFLPVIAMPGVEGRLFAPLAGAFVLATLASLVVALTVTPALCCALLLRRPAHEEGRFLVGLKRRHGGLLAPLLRRPAAAIAPALLLVAVAVAALPFLGSSFLPDFREGHIVIWMRTLPGTSVDESLRLGQRVGAELLADPHVATICFQVGRAELGEDTVGPDFGEFLVGVRSLPGEDAADVQTALRDRIAGFPGVSFGMHTFLAERMAEVISGETAQVVVRLYGEDLDALERQTSVVEQTLAGVRGAVDIAVSSPPSEPQVVVRLRRDLLAPLGLRPRDVLEAVQVANQGLPVAQVFDGARTVDVAVRIADEAVRDPARLGTLRVSRDDGASVPLSELADVYLTEGRHAVLHDGTRRYQAVTCNVEGRDVADFSAEAQAAIGALPFPRGVYTAFSGEAQEQARARQQLLLNALLAGALIVLLLALVFREPRHLLLVLVNVPFALVGGVLAVMLSGGTLSIGSLVGLVALFGITARNSIMLVSHYEHLVASEGCAWGIETALRGARERLVPILMTAIVTALGLLPLALESGETGREIEGPMAIVILGGLLTSTALNLLVLPALALRFGHFRPPADAAVRAAATVTG